MSADMDLFQTTPPLPFDLPSGEAYVAHWDEALRGYRITVPNGELIYIEQFFDRKISDRTVEYFQECDRADWRSTDWKTLNAEQMAQTQFTNIRWKQDYIRMYGKVLPLPRLTAWYGDSQKSYTYSGITSAPNEWNKGLLYLKAQIEQCAGVAFNSVLLNWYRSGEDTLSWHADDEPELGTNPVIASANFGATRDFKLRENATQQTITLPLKHGTLLIMRGALQHHWQHSVPKRLKVNGSRYNLTFRHIGERPASKPHKSATP